LVPSVSGLANLFKRMEDLSQQSSSITLPFITQTVSMLMM
jgi:hypothetical protein